MSTLSSKDKGVKESNAPVHVSLHPDCVKEFVTELAKCFPDKMELHLTVQYFSGNSGTINTGTVGGNNTNVV